MVCEDQSGAQVEAVTTPPTVYVQYSSTISAILCTKLVDPFLANRLTNFKQCPENPLVAF